MKVYREHNCSRQHRTYQALAKCMFPRAAWIEGEGEYASLAWCYPLTVMLFQDLKKAEAAKAQIDRVACGHTCIKRHDLVRLLLPAGRPG